AYVAIEPSPVAAVDASQLSQGARVSLFWREALEVFFDSLPLLWFCGGFGILIWTLAANWRMLRKIKSVSPCDDLRILALWRKCRECAGVRRTIPVILFDGVFQPAVMGLFRARLLLPLDAGNLSDDQLRMVMLHELAHVRRFDVA